MEVRIMSKMKKLLVLVLSLALVITMIPFANYTFAAKGKTKISKKKITLIIGQKKKLKIKNKPKGVKVKWKSKNKKIAKVSKKGKVKALKLGKTKIIAKVGKKKYKCKVIVKTKKKVVPRKAFVKPTVAPTKEQEMTVAPTEATTAAPTVAPTTKVPIVTTTKAPVVTTTKAPVVTTTKEPETNAPTTQPTTQPSNPTLPDIAGLVHAPGPGLPYYFAWAAQTGVDGYNVYLNGQKIGTCTASAYNFPESLFAAAGHYEIGVQAFKGDAVSKIAIVGFDVSGGGDQPTQPTQAPTEAPTVAPTTTQAPTNPQPTAQPTTQAPQPTTPQTDFPVDESLQVPFGIDVQSTTNGIIQVVWGAGEPNCYNVYVDGVRKKTKVAASVVKIPVQTEGEHELAIATVSKDNKESKRVVVKVNVTGTAPEEVETTAIPQDQMPQIDNSIQKQDGRIVLQLNNKTNNKFADNQIYWMVVGRNPSTHRMGYLDASGNLNEASPADNNGNINGRAYCAKAVHKLSDKKFVQLPAIESGRMYLSYGEPVYLTFNGSGQDVGYAGPDTNNNSDANYNTLFEYLEFTTESVNGGITFHGNTTRVDFFSFPMIARLTDEYGSYDRCVGDLGTRDQIISAYKNEVSNKFKTLVTDTRIICPAKLTFGEGKEYGNYFDDYINRFWNKYSSQDLVINGEAGNFTGRAQGNRLVFTNSQGTYYVDKPSTQDVLEGRGAFNRISSENSGTDETSRYRAGRELAIEAQLCAAFTRGVALDPSKWWDVSSYYSGSDPYNEYAAFFHRYGVSNRAYGFCYDDVNDQSTLVECGNAERFTIDLKW